MITTKSHLFQTLTVKKSNIDKSPPQGDGMDELLEKLKLEAEEERRRVYMERFGALPQKKMKEKDSLLRDFN